jgi:arginine deiminase
VSGDGRRSPARRRTPAAVAPRRCVMLEGNPVTRARLEGAGAEVFTYEGSEISLKGGGGPTCLTRPLARGQPA